MTEDDLEKLHEADADAARTIATLEEQSKAYAKRLDMHDRDIEQGRQNFVKLNDAIGSLRETISNVATKKDIYDLSTSISNQFIDNLKDARNSLPAKWAAWAGIGALIIMIATLAASFASHA